MSKYNKTILTNAGLDLAARASSGKTKFTITRAATSTEKLADKSISELQKLTALPSLMQYGEINNVADSAQDKSIVIGTELVFNNKDLTTGYNVNTIGLFAKEEGTNKEILHAITTAVEPETMPDYKDKVLFKFNLTMFVVVGQTDNVTVNVTQNGVVTQEQLAKAVRALPQKQDIANINNSVNNITDQMKNFGKVQKVNSQWPGLDGNVNINTADNITKLPDNSSFNDVIKPGFYRGNSLKDGPYTNVNDVFAVYGQKYAGSAITQVVYVAIHFDNPSRNYTRIYTRMGYFDSNLKVLWGNWNANIANIHINNADPDNNGNININTIDNPTVLANGTSLNSIVKPGFYLANNCKDSPIASYNEVFCVVGSYHAGAILTQFLPIGYYFSSDYFNNYTDLYLRTAYLDDNLIAHWGAFRKIPTTYA